MLSYYFSHFARLHSQLTELVMPHLIELLLCGGRASPCAPPSSSVFKYAGQQLELDMKCLVPSALEIVETIVKGTTTLTAAGARISPMIMDVAFPTVYKVIAASDSSAVIQVSCR